MPRSKTVGDALTISAGPLGAALSSIVLTLVLSWHFAPEVLGVLAVLELVALFFVMTFTLGLDQAYVREFAAASDKTSLFAATTRLPVFWGTAAAAVAMAVLPTIDVAIVPQVGQAGTAIALAYGLAALFLRMLSVYLRMGGSPIVFAALQTAQRGTTVVLVGLILTLSPGRDMMTAMLCYLGGALVSVALHLFFCRADVTRVFEEPVPRSTISALLRFGIPSAIAALLYALLASSDRISLALFGNDRDLGVYVVALSIAGSVTVFTSLFAILWAPLVYKNEDRARDPAQISPYLDIVTLLTFLAAAFVAFLSWFLPILFPADYAGIAAYVPACMAVPLFYILSEAFGIGIGVSRRMGFATLASAIGAAISIGLSVLLVPDHGAKGAACGILAGALGFLIARTEFGASLWYRLPSRKMYLATFAYVAGCAGSLFWSDQLGHLLLISWIAFALYCLLLFRQRIVMTISLARQAIGWSR
jgi:O-antigen/teichoic acid export membrane protein